MQQLINERVFTDPTECKNINYKGIENKIKWWKSNKYNCNNDSWNCIGKELLSKIGEFSIVTNWNWVHPWFTLEIGLGRHKEAHSCVLTVAKLIIRNVEIPWITDSAIFSLYSTCVCTCLKLHVTSHCDYIIRANAVAFVTYLKANTSMIDAPSHKQNG